MEFDPGVLSSVIGGLVSLASAVMNYKVSMKTAEQQAQRSDAKPDDDTLQKGEQTLTIVKAGIQDHGDDEEQLVLANFERRPTLYGEALRHALTDIATRVPDFRDQLQRLAQDTGIQVVGNQGSVNISGEARVDVASGVNTGTITYNSGGNRESFPS